MGRNPNGLHWFYSSGVLYNQFLSQADFETLKKYAEVKPYVLFGSVCFPLFSYQLYIIRWSNDSYMYLSDAHAPRAVGHHEVCV